MSKNKEPRVLLVEDDHFLMGIYKKKFELEGFKIYTAEDGESGYEVARKKHPSIVLLDVLLPKRDGFWVLEKIKNDPKTEDIPVVLLTNLAQKQDVEKGFELGACEYLVKTHFKPTELVEKVKELLNI